MVRALTGAATAPDRPGRRRPAAKMAARQSLPKGAKAQRVGRARSPLRAGVGSVQTRRLGRNPTVCALTSAATSRSFVGAESTLLILVSACRELPNLPEVGF